jgi:predicted transcriptional regulator
VAAVLISIRPRFVKLILSGEKQYELRRGRAKIEPGDTLVIYSTSPDRAVVATCEVKGRLIGSPACLLDKINGKAGIANSEFKAYLAGATAATALELGDVRRLATPISLKCLREAMGRAAVPRSYRFLSDDQARALGLRARRRKWRERSPVRQRQTASA